MFRGKNECQISLIDLLASRRCHLNFSLLRILALCGQQNHLLFDEGFPKPVFSWPNLGVADSLFVTVAYCSILFLFGKNCPNMD
jgi:hypothetical protein